MNDNRKTRKYQLTFNNPAEHENCTHEAIKELLQQWHTVYWCMCDEKGSTYHTHLFVQFQNPIHFSSIKKTFPTAHIEEAQGSAIENRNYIRKEGKHKGTDKERTNLLETFEESGDINKTGQGRRTDLYELYEAIKSGSSNTEIIEAFPRYLLNLSQIDRVRLEVLADRYRSERRLDLKVVYVSGKSGYGKSRYILDTHGDRNVYRITDYKHPFDTYANEDVLAFEEFRDSLPMEVMLNYLDIYPIQLPARYANKQACYHYVYIVSNWTLEMQYESCMTDKASYQAWLRRIHFVREYTAPNEYTEYSTEEYLDRFKLAGSAVPFSH